MQHLSSTLASVALRTIIEQRRMSVGNVGVKLERKLERRRAFLSPRAFLSGHWTQLEPNQGAPPRTAAPPNTVTSHSGGGFTGKIALIIGAPFRSDVLEATNYTPVERCCCGFSFFLSLVPGSESGGSYTIPVLVIRCVSPRGDCHC